jgi:hypothetical protein
MLMTIDCIATRACFALLALLTCQSRIVHGSGTIAGAITPAPAPSSVAWNQLQSDTQIFLIAEQSSVVAGANIIVDVDGTPGLYDEPADLGPGRPVIPAGTALKVHLLHFDPLTVPQRLTGTVTFPQQILGLAFLRASLVGSDELGALGTAYPSPETSNYREYELGPPQGAAADSAAISVDRRTLTVDMGVTAYYDQLRVFTAVPEPTMLGLVLAGAGSVLLRRRGHRAPSVMGRGRIGSVIPRASRRRRGR